MYLSTSRLKTQHVNMSFTTCGLCSGSACYSYVQCKCKEIIMFEFAVVQVKHAEPVKWAKSRGYHPFKK